LLWLSTLVQVALPITGFNSGMEAWRSLLKPSEDINLLNSEAVRDRIFGEGGVLRKNIRSR
jgi:hypothetical protein